MRNDLMGQWGHRQPMFGMDHAPFNSMGRQPFGDHQFPWMRPGGAAPPMVPPHPGGYDSSGINPHGMYNGTFGQPQFPHNPGGFQPMGLPQLMQFNRPSGLAAMFAR